METRKASALVKTAWRRTPLPEDFRKAVSVA
jgi:hypothetical protein